MASLIRIVSSSLSESITKLSRLSIHIHPLIPSQPNEENTIINTICTSLHKHQNWEILTQHFNSIPFTNSIIQNTLLHLKQPINAKKALNFFHWSAQQRNLQHSISTYSITIHILVKANLVKDAKALLESVLDGKYSIFIALDALIDSYKVTDSNPFVFDLFIQISAKLRLIDDVLKAIEVLDENGFMVSVISYNTVLYIMQKSSKNSLVWGVYEHMIAKRKYPNENTVKIMVDGLCKEGKLQKFVNVLERILGKKCNSPLVIVNTSLVYQMIEDDKIGDGLVLLKKMLQKNMILDVIAYSLVVFGKLKMADLEAAWDVFEEMLKRGFDGNAFVYTLFISEYCKKGKIEEAFEVLSEMENSGFKPFDETFNHLIKGCLNTGKLDESLKVYDRMMGLGFLPSSLVLDELIEKLCENGFTKRGDEILSVLLDKGFVPFEKSYSRLICGYVKEDCVEDALKVYYEMEYKSLTPCVLALDLLIVCLCKKKKLNEARKILTIMRDSKEFNVYEMYKEILGKIYKASV